MFAIIAEPDGVGTGDRGGTDRAAIALGEGVEIAHDEDAFARIQKGQVREGERDAVIEADIREVEGRCADIHELDEFIVVAIG